MTGFTKTELGIIPLEKRLMLDASLPAIAGQVLWLDAADASTILDADGDNANDGTGGNNDGFDGFVATWQDKSASGFDISAAGTERPQYGVDTQNSNNVMTFDGINDRLFSNDVIAGDDVTMFIVYNRTSATGRDAVFELGSGGSRNGVFLFANDTIQHYSSGTFRTNAGTYAQGDYHLSTYVHDGTNIDGWMNGASVLSTTTNLRAATTGITVGDDVTSSDEMTGTVAEILVYDRDLTNDERHDVETYLAGKWGLSITNAAPTVDTNTGTTLNEGAVETIDNTELSSSDADNTDSNLNYTITTGLSNGILTNTNTASTLSVGDTFTQGDIDSGFITYTHDGSNTIADSFVFAVSDGADSVTNQTFSITVTPTGTAADVNAIPNAVLHFDATDIDADGSTADQPADGTAIGSWRDDAGGTLSNATGGGGGRPLYDNDVFGYGKEGIVFDGVNDRLTFGSNTEVNNTTYTEKSYAFTFRTGTDVVSDQLVYEQGGGTHGINFGIFGGQIYAHQYRNGATISYAIDLGAAAANTTYQVIAVFDSGTNTWSANLNGGAFTTLATAGTMPGHSGTPALGNENGSTRNPITKNNVSGLDFDGAIGEFWSWNHALDATEIGHVSDYLTDRWFDVAPTIVTNATLDVVENAIISITNSNLDTNDIEAPDSVITYTLTALPSEGTLFLSGVALGMSDTFTQADLNAGLLTFDHDGTPAPGTDSFSFTVSDSFNDPVAGTFNFNIEAASGTDPILVANSALTLNEGASATITSTELDTSDGDTTDNGLTYTITADVTNGTLFNNGVAMGLNDTFTQDDINNNLITYTHNDGEVFTDNFTFTVNDGTTTLPANTFSFIVNPVNDQTPTDIALDSNNVNENVSNGTVVANISGTDADLPGDTLTYTIIADPDSKFQIVGTQLRTNGSLNHEASASHTVTIQVSDGTFTYNELFTINVNDLNENPTDIAIDNTTIGENNAVGTLIGTLSATDPDQPGDTFTYTIQSDPDGVFQINGDRLEVGANMDFETSNTHSVQIRVTDGNGGSRTETFNITVTNVNDTPIITIGNPSLSQGETITLTTAMLTATDQDNLDSGLIYEVTAVPPNGTVFLNGIALGLTDTFTQQDIIDGDVTYTHDNSASGGSDAFSFTVTDGTATAAASTLTISLDVFRDTNANLGVNEDAIGTIGNGNLAYDIGWFDNDWQYRRTITVDSAMIDADLTDYALLLTEANFDANFWTNVKADGSDIVIVDSAGNQLDRELVSINTVGQTMQLYVRTDLSSTVDTDLTIYYGNAAATETNATTTWRSEFQGVWHFDDDFNDGNASDSGQNANHGIAGNGFNSTNQVAGVTGSAAQFNNSEYLALNYSYQGNNTLPETSVSAWINTTDAGGSQSANWAVLDFDRSDFFNVYIHQDGRVGFSTTANGGGIDDFYSTGTTVNDGNWHHIAAVYDGTDKILYVDGIEVARDTNSHGGRDLGTNNTRFGFIGDGSEATSFNAGRNNVYYDGLFDDIRFYEGTLDAAWIAAEYRNHNNPVTFYSMAAEETRPELVEYTITDLPDNGTLFLDTVTTNGTLDAGEALGLGSTFTQVDIDSGLLLYEHDGGETTSDSIDFTVTQLGTGSTSVTQTFSFTITPVNDDPTALSLSNDTVDENVSNGTVIGTLGTTDVDLPGDTFTYSIVNDPDGKFQVVGNQLQVAGSLDFETATTHTVTLRTNDGNGGTFDQLFTINVGDLADNGFTPPPEEDTSPSSNPFNDDDTQNSFDRLNSQNGILSRSGILSAFLGNEADQFAAFYGDGIQIIRENTTFEIRELNENDAEQITTEATTPQEQGEQGPAEQASPEQHIQDRFTNLREALAFFEQMDEIENPDTEGEDADQSEPEDDEQRAGQSLDQQFVDVLTYHEKRQADLRKALLSG